jgi:ABC-type multidrug transport system fused ATPase/permease subunit
MVETMRKVLQAVLERLYKYVTIYLPSLLAALILFLAAFVTAVFARWLLYRIFKGPTIDRFLRRSGVAFMLDPSGRLRATRIVAEGVYWCLLLAGFLIGLSVFDTDITTQAIQKLVFLMPKIVVAGLILLGGMALGQYLGRGMLVWAVNEDFPFPRRLATLVRIVIMFVAVVVAADQLEFARNVFLAAFIILVGGGVLTVSLAVGLGAGRGFRRYFEEKGQKTEETSERSLWNHL